MEKFALLFRGGLAATSKSPTEIQNHMKKWMDWVDKLKKEGKYLSGEPLHPTGKKIAGPNKLVTDGPFTEGKDVIGGFFIISAEDYDAAVKISNDFPDYNYGGNVEVRQVMLM